MDEELDWAHEILDADEAMIEADNEEDGEAAISNFYMLCESATRRKISKICRLLIKQDEKIRKMTEKLYMLNTRGPRG